MQYIDHSHILAIAEAQKQKLEEINLKVRDEIEYIKGSINCAFLQQQQELIKNPFNHYLKITFRSGERNTEKIFLDILAIEYQKAFGHKLHLGKEEYYFLITSPSFINKQGLNANSQGHDPRTSIGSEIPPSNEEDDIPSLLFNKRDEIEFKRRVEYEERFAEEVIGDKKKAPFSARREKATTLVPLFLQRRLSKTIPPSLDSSREQSVNYGE